MEYPVSTIKKTEKDPTEIDESELVEIKQNTKESFFVGAFLGTVTIYGSSPFNSCALRLSRDVDWMLGKDRAGCPILVALKK